MSTGNVGTMNDLHGAMAEAHESRTAAYIIVAVVLTILTALEVWVSYIPSLLPVLVPILIVLSGAKFALVALFYMHLHYDSWAFTALFTPLLVLGAFVIMSLLALLVPYMAMS